MDSEHIKLMLYIAIDVVQSVQGCCLSVKKQKINNWNIFMCYSDRLRM